MEGLEEVLSPDGWTYASSTPVDADDPGRFHALFGRDSLLTALQVLPVRPDIARATLIAHARLQGTVDDPEIDEEPGKIIHECRSEVPEWLVSRGWPVRDGALRYYGSADATSWFLVVLASLGDREVTAQLEPAWRAAGDWLLRALERGGGLVRYGPRRGSGGLEQQGWRDTMDPTDSTRGGILRSDGSAPEPPLADADVQAAAVAALGALAMLTGDPDHLDRRRDLRARVEDSFDADTMALEADDTPVPGAGSQLGWLLWADALGPEAAGRAADRLAQPDVLTPHGLRTLSELAPNFDAHSYHRGSVWPFDSWLGWGGLRAAGRPDVAERVRGGVLAALDRLGRAPELYAVVDDEPQAIAIANRVQAWTVGARWALHAEWDGRAPEAGALAG